MASTGTITDCLQRLAGNYQCSQNWVAANQRNWAEAFAHVADAVLLDATRDWMVTGAKAPTMIEMREAVRHAAPRPAPSPVGHTCRRCAGDGRVPVLVLRRLPEPGIPVPHDEYLVGCSCPLGVRYHGMHGEIDALTRRWAQQGCYIIERPSPAQRYEAQGVTVKVSAQAKRVARATVGAAARWVAQ